MYEIRSWPHKGLGIFANRPIKRGERIICERPVLELNDFSVQNAERGGSVEELYDKFSSLSTEEREQYLQLHAAPNALNIAAEQIGSTNTIPKQIQDLCIKIAAIRTTNAICIDSYTEEPSGSFSKVLSSGVFLEASRLNHSCSPNSSPIWNSKTGCITVHAFKDILIDEEITISYINQFLNRCQRQKQLQGYGFSCTCPACDELLAVTEKGRTSENARLRIDRLNNDLDFFFKRTLEQRLMGPLSSCLIDSLGTEHPFQAMEELDKLASEEGLLVELLSKWCVKCHPSVWHCFKLILRLSGARMRSIGCTKATPKWRSTGPERH